MSTKEAITTQQRRKIQALLKNGELNSSQIAQQIGVNRQAVAAVRAWATMRERELADAVLNGHDIPAPRQRKKSGREMLHNAGTDMRANLLHFWQWSGSDLLSNATRGRLAEFLVARALGLARGIRREWMPFDLITRDGVTVEVKSAAYVQTWRQRHNSSITFGIRKTRAWDQDSATFAPLTKRQADVYVFALLVNDDRYSIDPLDVAQWEFYVLATRVLNERIPSQQSLSLGSLRALSPEKASFAALKDAIGRAINKELSERRPRQAPPAISKRPMSCMVNGSPGVRRQLRRM